MSGPSSSPRGEHAGTPGTHWDTALTTSGEVLIETDQDDDDPFAWTDTPTPRANRATRRAAARASRRNH